MLQVQAASCPYTAACTFNIPFPPMQLPETANLDLAILFFLRYNGIKVWVALVCMFFDHHMQVATDVQLR